MTKTQRNFVAGRMNKSIDERLLPNGEYVDAQKSEEDYGYVYDVYYTDELDGKSGVNGSEFSTARQMKIFIFIS